jgi:hypothetical protein
MHSREPSTRSIFTRLHNFIIQHADDEESSIRIPAPSLQPYPPVSDTLLNHLPVSISSPEQVQAEYIPQLIASRRINPHIGNIHVRFHTEDSPKPRFPNPVISDLHKLDANLVKFITHRREILTGDWDKNLDLGEDFICPLSRSLPRAPVRILGHLYDFDWLQQQVDFNNPNGFQEALSKEQCFKISIQPAYDVAKLIDEKLKLFAEEKMATVYGEPSRKRQKTR